MAQLPDVLGFGAVAIDQLIYVDRPLSIGKGRVIDRQFAHGGNVATALAAVATLGGRAGFIGWLGTDTDSEAAMRAMETQGVDLSHAPRSSKARPVQSVITVGSDGERFIAFDDDTLIGAPETLDDTLFQHASAMIIDGYSVGSLKVAQRARDLGVQVVADIEWSAGPNTDTLMGLADHLVLPWGFASKSTGTSDPRSALKSLWSDARRAVVLTDGDSGSYILQRGDPTLWHLPAHRVEVVDTTGAGDCFHGAYAFALAQGMTPLDSTRFASAAAAISTTGHGGRGALPTRDDCQSLMHAEAAPRPEPMATT